MDELLFFPGASSINFELNAKLDAKNTMKAAVKA